MKLLFIGDIIGKPGRVMLTYHLPKIIKEHNIDFVIANGENSAHGFGINYATSKELFNAGVNLITGGNHSFDKQEIVALFKDKSPIIRPLNYPQGTPGEGVYITKHLDRSLAIVNLLGFYQMGIVDNPFNTITKEIQKLKSDGIQNIFIDFHAETTAEKNTLLAMLKGEGAFIAGTHTHIGTDDLVIQEGTGYVTDVGLTGCRDGVIGMASQAPIYRATTGMRKSHQIPKQCKKILQAIVCEINNGKCSESYKLKAYDFNEVIVSQKAYLES